MRRSRSDEQFRVRIRGRFSGSRPVPAGEPRPRRRRRRLHALPMATDTCKRRDVRPFRPARSGRDDAVTPERGDGSALPSTSGRLWRSPRGRVSCSRCFPQAPGRRLSARSARSMRRWEWRNTGSSIRRGSISSHRSFKGCASPDGSTGSCRYCSSRRPPRPFEAKCSGSICAWTGACSAFVIRLPERISSAMRRWSPHNRSRTPSVERRKYASGGKRLPQEAAEARVAELKAQLRDLPGGSITPRASNP